MQVTMLVLKDEAGSYTSKASGAKVPFRRLRGIEATKGGFDAELQVELDPSKPAPQVEERSTVVVNITGLRVFDRDVRFLGAIVPPSK